MLSTLRILPFLFLALCAFGAAGTFTPYSALSLRAVSPDGHAIAIENSALVLLDSNGQPVAGFKSPLEIGTGERSTSSTVEIAFAPDGSLFLSGNIYAGGQYCSLIKLTPQGALDPEFQPVKLDWQPTVNGSFSVGVPHPTPDGGCFIGGSFSKATTLGQDTQQVFSLIYVDRLGDVHPLVKDKASEALIIEPLEIVQIGAATLVASYRGIWKVSADGKVEAFTNTPVVDVSANNGRILSAAYDPRFGLAVIAYGKRPGQTGNDIVCAIYSENGSNKPGFDTSLNLGSLIGSGLSVNWDNQGHLLIANIHSSGIKTKDGMIDDINPSIWAVSDLGNVIKGAPRSLFSIRRLLPSGTLDPEWSKAFWYPIEKSTKLWVLSDNSILGNFDTVCGVDLGVKSIRLSSNKAAEVRSPLSMRGWLKTGQTPIILGLVIDGKSSTDVLIRALGPSLANFNVTNHASSTLVALYSGSKRLYSCYRQSSTTPVKWATQRTGLAPLLTSYGSDSMLEGQLLTQLPPGIYTIHVTGGESEVEGEVLCEVYFP